MLPRQIMHVVECAGIVEIVGAAHARVQFHALAVAENRRLFPVFVVQAHAHPCSRFEFQEKLVAVRRDRGWLNHAAGKDQRPFGFQLRRRRRAMCDIQRNARCRERQQAADARQDPSVSPQTDQAENRERCNESYQFTDFEPYRPGKQ